MNKQQTVKSADLFAQIISVVFNPVFMPLYGLGIIFNVPDSLCYLPVQVKKILFFIMLSNNILIPLVLIIFLRNRNIISSYFLESKDERVIPLVLSSLLFLITSYIFCRFHIPLFYKSYIFAVTFLSIILTFINFWWKISVHSAAAGSITALVLIITFRMQVPLTYYLIAVIIVAGMVLSARLRLNVHNQVQAWTGFFTGLAGFIIFFLFS